MSFTRFAGVCAAGLTLAVAPFTAGSALAAGPTTSLTAASCSAQGGTFTKAHGVKTCTIGPTYRTVSYTTYRQANSPYDVDPNVIEVYSLTADAYSASFTVTKTYRDTTVLTQKGGGSITTQQTSVLSGDPQISNQTCTSLTIIGDSAIGGDAFIGQCEVLHLYTA